jgi:hypothetical protein
MVECIFTIDYEIYGNGKGSLRELVFEPARRLAAVFEKWNAKFVAFVETAELQKLEEHDADEAIADVRRQVYEFHRAGNEIGLHLHPQWCNAVYRDGGWVLDYDEYNLCGLPRERISEIVESSIAYLRDVVAAPDFTPHSFRAGNWLFQPSQTAAEVLAEKGFKIDSSVCKGIVERYHGMDYRPALRNGDFWRFGNDVNTPDPAGALLEIPTYTKMVAFWEMLTAKRVGMKGKGFLTGQSGRQRLSRLLDRLRFRYPLKFDFCRMTLGELTSTIDEVIGKDRENPTTLKPLVAIGHTKDLMDLETVEAVLCYLKKNGVKVSTFKQVYQRCLLPRHAKP